MSYEGDTCREVRLRSGPTGLTLGLQLLDTGKFLQAASKNFRRCAVAIGRHAAIRCALVLLTARTYAEVMLSDGCHFIGMYRCR
jgi:hypothetical protein